MITTKILVDDICEKCPYFKPVYAHFNTYSNFEINGHIISIICSHDNICKYVRKFIKKGDTDGSRK